MKSDAEREPAADATRRRDSQIGHGAVTLEQIRDRLRDARRTIVSCVRMPKVRSSTSKTAADDDASHRGPGEHERREARAAER